MTEREFIVESGMGASATAMELAGFPELIRCKDCKHWYFADNRIPSEQENVCGRNGIIVTPDWFCADGERAET